MQKEQVKDRLLKLFDELRSNYIDNPEMLNIINTIYNDLLNNQFDSLNSFINNYYQDIPYNPILQKFIQDLVASNLLSDEYITNYIKEVKDNHEILSIKLDESMHLVSHRPINIKLSVLEALRKESITEIPTNTNTDTNYTEIDFNHSETATAIVLETTPLEQEDYSQELAKEKLKKVILETQLNYVNDPIAFISYLETMSPEDMYQRLLDLNDIRFITHCLSHSNQDVLENLLEMLLKKNTLIDNTRIYDFIIQVINKTLDENQFKYSA